jgi:hypothetical protein
LKEDTMRNLKSLARLVVLTVSSTALMVAYASGASPSTDGFKALSAKQNGSGVEIDYRIEGGAVVGSPLTIVLKTSSPADAQVALRAGEGLALGTSQAVLRSVAGQVTEHRVQVTPQREGRFYLYIESTANGRGSASAIAVQVGKTEVQRKPSGSVQSMPNGERVISVPAK